MHLKVTHLHLKLVWQQLLTTRGERDTLVNIVIFAHGLLTAEVILYQEQWNRVTKVQS